MNRRDLLRSLGAAAAVALLPREAAAAWARVASGAVPADGLTDKQLALVGAIADAILPRTDTPSATDVGVPAFVNVIVSENYTEADRATFVAGLDALDAQLTRAGTATAAVEAIESLTDRRSEPARTYWRLKGLVIHGYFTSERVVKEV